MNRRQLSKNLGIVVFLVLLCLVPLFVKAVYWIHVLIFVALNVLVAVGLRTISRVGEISLGTAGFMLIGGYTSALLAMKVGLSVWITLPLGGLFAAAVSIAVGYPFFRLKGVYFLILTLFVSEIFRVIAAYWSDMTGGLDGLRGIPPPGPITIPGIATISFDNEVAYYYLVLVIVVLGLFILYRMEHARIGLVWGAIREADNLAQSVGINIMLHKIFIFSVACFFTGIVGGLYAHYLLAISPTGSPGNIFAVFTSIYIVMYVVVGGTGSFAGPIIGAILLTIVPEMARPLKELRPFVFGGILIVFMFFLRKGLVGLGDYFPIWYRKVLGRLRKDRFSKGLI